MADFEKSFLEVSKMQDGAYAKALANYLFREVIEDAHEKYNISQDDMEQAAAEKFAKLTAAAQALGVTVAPGMDVPALQKAITAAVAA